MSGGAAGEFWRPLRRPSYLACCTAFAAHQIAQRLLDLDWWPADHYLDPLLSIPLLLSLAEAEQRWLLRGRGWRGYSALEIAAMTAALALVFEFAFPRLDPSGQTYDPLDFVAYGVGGLLYGYMARGAVGQR